MSGLREKRKGEGVLLTRMTEEKEVKMGGERGGVYPRRGGRRKCRGQRGGGKSISRKRGRL